MRTSSLLLSVLATTSATHAALNCSLTTFAALLSENSATIDFVQTLANNASFSPPGGLEPMRPPKGAEGPPKGAGGPPGGIPVDPRVLRVPSLCALQAKVKSSESSEYSFGVFLPEQWNGRFLYALYCLDVIHSLTKRSAVGNGGFAGSISWNDMVTYVHRGFAVVSTDAGTRPGRMGDASWAYKNPERITDW